MKIIVAVKQVASREAALAIDASGHWIDESDLSWEINEPDAYALEAALQVKEKHGGEVIALSLGPPRAAQTLRETLAKGADRAIHVEMEGVAALDSLRVARLLAASARPERPDLILTGLQSDDVGAGQTGVILAEVMGLPHASIVVQVEVTGAGARVKRELEGGWYQHVELPLPAVLTIQSGIGKLRYATLMGIKKAKSKEIRRIAAEDLGIAVAGEPALERLHWPERAKRTEMIAGSAQEAAARLVEKLKFEARAL
jgi:electron transfer flavoprotein beta subunit